MVTAPHCSPSSPVMCAGRARLNATGPGIWYSYEARTWLWVPEGLEGIVGITHCPKCRAPLPRLLDSILKALRDTPLANPDE